MPVKSGIVLSKSEILTEHGVIEKYQHKLAKRTKIWIYYNNNGRITNIEEKQLIIPIQKTTGDGDG